LDTDELSAFTLEFIDDGSLGGDIDRAIAVKNFLRRPASDSAQTHIDHFSTPGNYSGVTVLIRKLDYPGNGHFNHEQNRNQPVFASLYLARIVLPAATVSPTVG
jgi:hypothetical protein